MSATSRGPLGPAGNNVRRNVRRLREQRYWGYRDVSERLSDLGHTLHPDQLSAIDTGERRVDVDDLVALALVFDLTSEHLLQPPADCQHCRGVPQAGTVCVQCETTGLPTRT